jgi:hypothetical protein
MKPFREFIIEKSEADPISRKDAEKLQRMARPETSPSSAKKISRGLESAQARIGRKTRKAPSALSQREIASAWKSGSEGKPSVMATSSKPEGGTWFGSSKETIKKGQEKLRQQVRDTLAKNKGGSAELQAAQSSGPKETMVGKGAKPGTGETYRAGRPSETRATGVSSKKGRVSGSVSKGDIKFSGDAKYREMLAKMPDAKPTKPRTRTVKQSNVSQQAAEFRADYKTPKGERAYQTAKVDIDTRRAFPTGKGGLKADEANPFVKRGVRQARADKLGGNVWDMPKGSNRPFKSSKPRDVSKITAMKQSRQMGLPKIDWKSSVKSPIPKKQIPKGAPSREATKQAIQFLRKSREKTIAKKAVASIPTPKTIPTKANPPSISGTPMADKVFKTLRASKSDEYSKYAVSGKGPKGEILDNAARKRYKNLARTPFGIEKFVPDKPKATGGEIKPAKPTRQPRLAGTTKAKPLSTFAEFGKKVRGLGKFTGPAAAGIDVAMGYADERGKGASKKRSLAKGVTKALGGALGGTLGAVGGGGLGSAALGVAGYTAGSALAGKAFDVAAGATAKQKAEIAKQSRVKQKMQSVVRPTKTTTVQSGDIVTRRTAVDPTKLAKTKVIRDKSGKERVGYLVKKGSTYGYKTGADPSTLAKTSSNPLERIGRTLMPGAYVQSDEAARKKRVAALKAKG